MSRRLDTTVCRRSASSSMVSLKARTSSRVHSTSAAEEARRGSLDVGERRPEVVRHRDEQRLANLVHLGQGSRRRRPGSGVEARSGRVAAARRTPRAACGPRSASVRPDTASIEPFTSSTAIRGVRPASSGPSAHRRGHHLPSTARRSEHRRGIDIECPVQLGDQSMPRLVVEHRRDGGQLGQCLDLGLAGRASCAAPAGQAVDEDAHQRRHRDEHDEASASPACANRRLFVGAM